MMNETDVLGESRRWLRRFVVSLLCIVACSYVRGGPVINEIHYHPALVEGSPAEPVEQEFVELYNPSEEGVDLSGYAFTRGIRFTFSEGTLLGPDGYLVVAANPQTLLGVFPELVGEQVLGPWSGTLSNSGEQIRLVDPSGETVDKVTYADQGDWADRREASPGGWTWETRADGRGRSLELRNASLTNDLGQNWTSASLLSSPGARNTRALVNLPPMIQKVGHSPAVPRSDQAVTVRADIIDEELAEVTVSVHWRDSLDTDSPFLEVPMSVESEGSSTYVGTIPSHSDKAVVEFYVRASDSSESRTWPGPTTVPSVFAEGRQAANALYQVDDEVVSGGAIYRLILSAPERRTFDSLARSRDDLMNATLITEVGGETEVRYRCGVRFRGNSSRNTNPPPKRLSIPRDNSLHGETSINLNSRSPHNQLVGNMLFAAAGLVAPQARLIQVRENGRDLTSHVHILSYGPEFVDEHFPNERMGNLYRKRSASGNRNVKRWGVHSLRAKVYERERWYVDDSWDKATNSSKADWSDLQRFVETMDQAEGDGYVAQVREVLHPEQWVRWFAVMTLLGNTETNLSNGIDDDYAMISDQQGRFLLLPHDLDSLFGFGAQTGLFPMIDTSIGSFESQIPQLRAFFNQPEFVSMYYTALEELIETVFSKSQFDRLVQGALSGSPLSNRAGQMTRYMDERREFVRRRLEPPLSVRPQSVPTETSARSLTVSGNASFARHSGITVNGIEATINGLSNTWQVADLPLHVGSNSIVIRSFDREGRVVDSLQHRVNVPNVLSLKDVSGMLEEDATWSAADGAYRISKDLIVPPGITLTIEPGTSLFVRAGVKIVVQGTLLVGGDRDRQVYIGPDPSETLIADIHPRLPMTLPKWGGILFEVDTAVVGVEGFGGVSSEASMLASVDVAHAQSVTGSIFVRTGSVTLDDVQIEGTRQQLVRNEGGAIRVRNCRFPGRFAESDDLELLGLHQDNPQVFGRGSLTLEGNFFGQNRGLSSVIKVEGADLAEILSNTFAGAEGNLVEAENALLVIQGNTFQDAHTAISSSGDVHASHNRFANLQHVVGEGSRLVFEQNTVVGIGDVVIDRSDASILDNLFWEVSQIVVDASDVSMRFESNVVPVAAAESLTPAQRAANLLVDDPAFIDDSHRLAPHALARRANRFASEVGAYGPRGAQVVLENQGTSLHIGGGGLTAFLWKLDGVEPSVRVDLEGGARSAVLNLADLAPGEHVLEVEGIDAVDGVRAPPTKVTWLAGAGDSPMVIDELLIRNQSALAVGGRFPDAVELRNTSGLPFDLEGYTLRDGVDAEDGFTFPLDTVLDGSERLVVYGGDADPAHPDFLWLGFSFSEGEAIVLEDGDGQIVAEVFLGSQLVDQSLNRRVDGTYYVAPPSLGDDNAPPLPLGDPTSIVLNEWLIAPLVSFQEDYIELFNPLTQPADLGGYRLTDDPTGMREAFVFPSPALLGPGEFLVMTADDLPFGLDGRADWIVLQDPGQRVVDSMFVSGLLADQAMGRFPDGDGEVVPLDLGTPGLANYVRPADQQNGEFLSLIDLETSLRYHEGDPEVGDAWRESDFDDTPWSVGTGIFATEPVFEGLTFTEIAVGPPSTHYVRARFSVVGRRVFTDGNLFVVANAGAVAYLNGVEIGRLRMPQGEVTAATLATGTSLADGFEQMPVNGVTLLDGENVLAVEFHQATEDSTLARAGIFLSGQAQRVGDDISDPLVNYTRILADLRVTEIMYAPEPSQPDAEFIELMNIGNETLDLSGVRFTNGIRYVFPEGTVLGAREFVLVVKDLAAFEQVYGNDLPVSGAYDGRLDNGGERVALRLPKPYEAAIAYFDYEREWESLTDGGGYALQIRDPQAARSQWDASAGWTVSGDAGGSPGDNGVPAIGGVLEASGTQADPFSYTIVGLNFPTRFEAVELPDGLELDASNGVISGESQVFGSFEIVLTAYNPAGASETATLVLDFAEKLPPVITSALKLEPRQYQEVNYQLAGTNLPQSFSTVGLPLGLTMNEQSGLIRGFPEEVGTFMVEVSAANFAGTATEILEIVVGENIVGATLDHPDRVFRFGEIDWRPELFVTHDGKGSLGNARVDSGQTAWVETTVTGPDVITFWWMFNLDNGFGSADVRLDFQTIVRSNEEFGWEPVTIVVPEGEHRVRWSITNFSDTRPQLFLDEMIFASGLPEPLVSNDTMIRGNVGSLLSFPIEATGEPTSFSIREGPNWLSVDPDTGIVSGTPTGVETTSVIVVATNEFGSGERFIEIDIEPTFDTGVASLSPSLIWSTGGDRSWRTSLTQGSDDNGSVFTGNLTDSQSSWLETSVVGPGELAFKWDVGSEECCDRLQLLVDGNWVADIGGRVVWEAFTTQIGEGEHTVRWIYEKDGSVAENGDRARLDEVLWTPETPLGTQGLETWLALYGVPQELRGPHVDSDGDGLPNLVEFAFDLDPGDPDVLPHVWTQLKRDEAIVIVDQTTRQVPVTVVLEVSDDLQEGSWQSAGIPVSLSATDSTTLTLPGPLPGRQRYARIRLDL